jgi:ABC-2 type transport system ATP-binding protein
LHFFKNKTKERHMIHVEDVTKFYHALCAVDHINLHIEKGEILGLLGPNGAGKTTTLRMLTGFLRPTSGRIRVKEMSIGENPLEIKKMMGYLPESAPLYHEMLVYDYLKYVAAIRNLNGQQKHPRIRELADLCGLREVMHQSVGELSKGYKQRVGLAHAMMSDPEILVLDEPTSGLDPNQIVEIRDIIRRIGKQKTIILSTHILSEAEATCDRVVIINRGKIVADDSTEALKRSASGEYTVHMSLQKAALAAVKEKFADIEGIQNITLAEGEPDDSNDILHAKVVCKATTDLRGVMYEKIKETDWVLVELHRETRSLENIFRELTKEQ